MLARRPLIRRSELNLKSQMALEVKVGVDEPGPVLIVIPAPSQSNKRKKRDIDGECYQSTLPPKMRPKEVRRVMQ